MKFRRSTKSASSPAHRPAATRVKLPSPWQLFRAALRDYRLDFWRYIRLLALVAVPINILGLIPASDGTTGAADPVTAFTPFAAIIMNVALIWAMIRRAETGTFPSLAQAYYDGSAALVRYLLVSSVLVIMLLPAAFAATFYGVGILGGSAAGATLAEQVLIGLVCFVLIIPSFYLLVRHGLASFATVREGYRPIAALRLSRSLTSGRFWSTAGRMLMMGVFIGIISLPVTALTIFLLLVGYNGLAAVVFEIITTLIALPLTNLYLFHLYRALEHAQQPRPETAAVLKPATV
jgi:hypothetical protein